MYNERTRWIILGLLAIVLFGVALPDAYAQGANLPGKKNSSHFIRRWLALGPFIEGEQAQKAIEEDYLFAATGIPESQFATLEGAPKPGDSVSLTLKRYNEQVRTWTMLELPENGDVNRMLVGKGAVDFAVAYLLTFIKSKKATICELSIDADDAVMVWLNGRMKFMVAPAYRTLRVVVDVKEGMNCLMFKVADSTIYWRLIARFDGESGSQFFDIPSRQREHLGQPLITVPKPYEHPKPAGPEDGWKTYTGKDGLAENDVYAITQDNKDAMWFGTQGGGVSRFGGKNWKTYTKSDGLANNFVFAIIQDNEGAMWF